MQRDPRLYRFAMNAKPVVNTLPTSFGRLFPSDGQPFRNPVREGLPTILQLTVNFSLAC